MCLTRLVNTILRYMKECVIELMSSLSRSNELKCGNIITYVMWTMQIYSFVTKYFFLKQTAVEQNNVSLIDMIVTDRK